MKNRRLPQIAFSQSLKGSKHSAPSSHFLPAEINGQLLTIEYKCYPSMTPDFRRALDLNQCLSFNNMMSQTDKQFDVVNLISRRIAGKVGDPLPSDI